jgi:hypothetical protein
VDKKIEQLLQNREQNHMLPFLWVHGEPHETYRRMVKAIHDANIRAFCVEARPHKNFCKEQWWQDMDVILDEAEKRDMQVWILDDKHFPTGFANGGVKDAPLELHRQSLCHKALQVDGGKTVRIKLEKHVHPKNKYDAISMTVMLYINEWRLPPRYHDDQLLSCTAYGPNGLLDLSAYIQDGVLSWDVPQGNWEIEILSLSRNAGMRRSYMNMMDRESCRILINEVYEPHYAHYKDKFGKVIAGFFSDEPELGNFNFIKHNNTLGTEQDLPFSRELAAPLEEHLGQDWKNLLALLWRNDCDAQETARVRYIYMDCVTRLVEDDFSKQVGTWCRERGVQYIGHVIEDNNQHARTSTSLGHFFRGLKWQTMAGIDNVNGQIYPLGEDRKDKTVFGFINDGEFYHYALGKLGSSLGDLNPQMQDRTMCELFGNYGWSEGVRLEKYLLDHFMVRGVNHFVPHAFDCKDYPDRDCPPHFYAHGHDPLYRHFGKLVQYGNRVCSLLSEGSVETPVAILYHGEAEWTGKCMLMQKPARVLLDNQIDFHFVPSDMFAERDFYKTEVGKDLTVNSKQHRLLLIPYAQFITKEVAQGIAEMLRNSGKVAFIDALPDGICTGELLPDAVRTCDVVKLATLVSYLEKLGLKQVTLQPANDRIRSMHYVGQNDIYYLFNEGADTYRGTMTVPKKGNVYGYDAWNDTVHEVAYQEVKDGTNIVVNLEPSKSLILIFGKVDEYTLTKPTQPTGEKIGLSHFTQTVAKSIDYPRFKNAKEIDALESYSNTDKKFSGFIRYETSIELGAHKRVVLEITDAYEGVEVFMNGRSAGIQVVPTFIFDITDLCKQGQNELVIEVATTLERERCKVKNAAPTGITGSVNLYLDE